MKPKFNFILISLILILANTTASTQPPNLIPFLYGSKWGYCDQQGNMLIPAVYEDAKPFSDGIAMVRKNFSWGLIDTTGKPLCEFKYHRISEFFSTCTKVEIGDQCGFINNRGKEIVPVRFDNATVYKDVIVVSKNSLYGLYDSTGTMLLPTEYQQISEPYGDLVLVKKEDKYGFSDRKGNPVAPTKYDYLWYPVNGICFYQQELKYGYIDSTGRELTQAVYDNIWAFINGFAQVQKDTKMGILNRQGEEIVAPVYDYAHTFSEGRVIIGTQGKYGFCNGSGEIVIPLEYQGAWPFSEGLAKVYKDGKWGFIDTLGQVVIPFQYEEVNSFSDGLAGFRQNGEWGYLDKQGNVAIPPSFESIKDFSEGLAVCRYQGKYGVIDPNGGYVLPARYDTVYFRQDNRISLKTPQGTGLASRTGEILIPPLYDWATGFTDQLFQVSLDDKVGLVDHHGNPVLPLEYNMITLDGQFPFGLIEKDILYGLIGKDGKVILPCQYSWLNFDENGNLLAEKDGKWGILDTLGQTVVPFDFLNLFLMKDGLSLARISYEMPDVYVDITGKAYYQVVPGRMEEPGLPEVTKRDSEVHSLTSRFNNREYKIHVFLPLNYYKSNKTYPVLYLPDADAVEGIVSESAFMLAFEKKIPELIIVGISYDTTFEEYYKKRIRDLTPTDDKYAMAYPGGGGSGLFYRFFREELIPFIEQNYRYMEDERILTGYSLSGLFASFALFHDPTLFSRYILVSPSLWWDNMIALSWESEYYKEHKELPAVVYMSLSGGEWGAVEEMNTTLTARQYQLLTYTFEKIQDETHFTTFPAAFVRGIKKVYSREEKKGMF
jgi:predicted alpha/beta superfamily hydrolase